MTSFTADKIAHRFANPFARWAKQPQTKTTATGVPADFYDNQGGVVGAKDVNAGPVVNPEAQAAARGKSAARKWLAASIGGTAAAVVVLAFAGYGMFAAAPHIHAGVATFFGSAAGHWAGIGLGVGIGVAALTVGVYVGVKKFNAWRHVRAERIANKQAQAAADQALLAQAQAAQAAGFPPGAFPQDNDAEGNNVFWQGESPFPDENTLRQDQVAPETPVLRPAVPATPAPGRQAAISKEEAAVISRAARNNWATLSKRFGKDATGYKNWYAVKILEYRDANPARRKALFDNEMAEYDEVFPELADQKTFEAAMEALVPMAEIQNARLNPDARRP